MMDGCDRDAISMEDDVVPLAIGLSIFLLQ